MSTVIRRDVPKEMDEFGDIDKFIEERIRIEEELHEDSEFWLDVMSWALRMVQMHGAVRPADVYIGLLESGDIKHYKFDPMGDAYSDCVMYLGMLLPLNLFACESDEESNGKKMVTEYTVFKPVVGDRLNYFDQCVHDRKSEIIFYRYSPTHYEATAFQFMVEMRAWREATVQARQEQPVSGKQAVAEANHERWRTQQAQKRAKHTQQTQDLQASIDPAVAAQRAKWREQKQKQSEKKQRTGEKLRVRL